MDKTRIGWISRDRSWQWLGQSDLAILVVAAKFEGMGMEVFGLADDALEWKRGTSRNTALLGRTTF
jgi:hypothetical protein